MSAYLKPAVQRPGDGDTLGAAVLGRYRLFQVVKAIAFSKLFHQALDRLLGPFLLLLGPELSLLPAEESLLYRGCEGDASLRGLQEVFDDAALTPSVHFKHLSHQNCLHFNVSVHLFSLCYDVITRIQFSHMMIIINEKLALR